jgi:hypothetical protein
MASSFRIGALVVATVLVPLAGVAWAQTQPSASVPGGVVVAERTTLTATVEAVDKGKRTVTLRGPQGRTVSLKAPKDARNFEQIQVGDTVQAEYLDAVALFVRKPGAAPSAGEATSVRVAPPGERPAAVMVDTVQLTARVEAIDYDTREVTLRGPRGNTRTVKVDPQVERLNEVKVGDEVVVRHTEAVALTVRRNP